MPSEKTRTLGYLCPACRKTVVAARDAFALTASGASVRCDCGGSRLDVTNDGRRFRLRVPCGVCGGAHTAEVEAVRLLTQGVGLACPQTKQLCCFIGEDYEVTRALERLSRAAEKEADGELFADSLIMHEVLAELREIAARPRGISCACGSTRYTMEVRPTYVDLICADCGARLRVDAATDDDLDRLCARWTLQIGGA